VVALAGAATAADAGARTAARSPNDAAVSSSCLRERLISTKRLLKK
jgi:hypothetical protein